MGIHTAPQLGSGSEFHQLREFRVGDALNHVDWKASARSRKIITKEFQEEKQQQVLLLLDTGQNMNHQHGEPHSHFEKVLNSVILQAYVTLKQGDHFGLLTFAGEQRWQAPHDSNACLNGVIETLFDIQPGPRPADYLDLAKSVQGLVQKRSLIIIVTQLRAETENELLLALTLMGKRHHVLIATLKEDELQHLAKDDKDPDLMRATQHFLKEREAIKTRLKGAGASIVDCAPDQFCSKLINAYLAIKARKLL
jgi:uncharacterized protein (DUF58 family)